MQKYVNLVDLEKLLTNAYLAEKIGLDTEENEPSSWPISIYHHHPTVIYTALSTCKSVVKSMRGDAS